MINTVRNQIIEGTTLEIGDIVSWNKLTNKPSTKLVEQIYPLGTISPESIMIGDAAGRQGDWSSVDKDFATNLCIQFYTPEEFFSSHTITVLANKQEPSVVNYTRDIGEIVLMVGLPGSGKSTFCKNYLAKYQYISGDILKTTPKMVKAIKECYSIHRDNLRLVVDACNHTVEKRKTYIDLASQLGLPIRCIWIDVAKETAIAQNELRKDTPGYLPKIAIYTIAKRFEAPSSSEGIEIITIN
jgi:bifunctional polynucleotide phosphatase/kinase